MAKQTFTTGQVLTAAQMTSLQQTAMGGGSATAKTASYVLVAADAGGTVIMNAAGSTTITVNTGLFAAGDTVLIVNTGAGTCTITNGSATVSTAGSLALTQYESGILYFTATGTAIFNDYVQASSNPLTTTGDMIYSSSGSTQARLAIGSTSQVLTVAGGVPSWQTPAAAASGLTLISTLPLSAVSTIDFNNVFDSTYTNYRIVYNGVVGAGANTDNINFRFKDSGGVVSSSIYYWSGIKVDPGSGTVTGQNGAAVSSFKVGFCAVYPGGFQIELPSPNTATNHGYNVIGAAELFGTFGGTTVSSVTATGFNLFTSNSATMTGNVSVYGYQK